MNRLISDRRLMRFQRSPGQQVRASFMRGLARIEFKQIDIPEKSLSNPPGLVILKPEGS